MENEEYVAVCVGCRIPLKTEQIAGQFVNPTYIDWETKEVEEADHLYYCEKCWNTLADNTGLEVDEAIEEMEKKASNGKKRK